MANKKRLIDPTAYKSFLKRYIKELYEVDAPMIAGAVERCLQKLEVQPTVNAAEAVHGRWEWYEALVNPYALCSNCGCGLNKTDALNFAYCPYCGAKMDGERKSDG